VAQSEPAAEQAIVPAGLNADKIDGRHAVGHGASARKRAGKLVATNKKGQLPSNIVKPAWRLILGKPAAFRDGQIGWGEVQGMPPGFADGVDHMGMTGITLTRHGKTYDLPKETEDHFTLPCPTGKLVSGGFWVADPENMRMERSRPIDNSWQVGAHNVSTLQGLQLDVYVICMSTDPGSAIIVAKKGKTSRGK